MPTKTEIIERGEITVEPKTCPRCAGLGVCQVYSFAAQKPVEAESPVCDGCGEVEGAIRE